MILRIHYGATNILHLGDIDLRKALANFLSPCFNRKVSIPCIWKALCICAACAISMITESSKYHCRHVPMHESYEDKYERRQEKHESLRRRNNITVCRLVAKCPSKEPKEILQSPRQKEFFRRRNLITEKQENKQVRSPPGKKAFLILEHKMEDFAKVSSGRFMRSSPMYEVGTADRKKVLQSKLDMLHSVIITS